MNKYQSQFIKIMEGLAYRFSMWDVFNDFCSMAAWNLRQAFYPKEAAEVFKRLDEKYNQEQISQFAQAFICVVESLEAGYGDFLGECYMAMELGKSQIGQFFTPYPVCKVMAKSTLDSDIESKLNTCGYMTICDPACGAGATLIATVDIAREQGLNPSENLLLYATDIDLLATHMCYIQLSLCGVAALVTHGDTLRMETWSQYLTPVWFINNWQVKYDTMKMLNALKLVFQGENDNVAIVDQSEDVENPDNQETHEVEINMAETPKAGQMAFDFMFEREAV